MMQVQNISFKIGNKTILNDISFDLQPGELGVIIGANGAGKSTLLKCLSGELPFQKGQVYLNSHKLSSFSVSSLAQVRAILTQKFILNLPFKIEEVVEMGRYAFSKLDTSEKRNEIVAQAMMDANVSHLSGRLYTSLSGGEQQRVHFARVLAQLHSPEQYEPRYLFLDEPVSSLDVLQQFLLFDRVKALMKQGVGVLAVVHDLNLACQYADSVIALYQGRVVACGKTAEVIDAELIHTVYGIKASLVEHPITGKPQVLFGHSNEPVFTNVF